MPRSWPLRHVGPVLQARAGCDERADVGVLAAVVIVDASSALAVQSACFPCMSVLKS